MKLPPVYGLLDGGLLASRGIGMVEAAGALLEGGIRMLQIRWKEHFSRDVFRSAETVARLCREAGAMLVINDRADMAMLLDTGLHIGQEDLPPTDARKLIGTERLLGFSTHNENQLRAAAGEQVDYIALGPIFSTRTKANPDPEVGLAELARLRQFSPVPLVAIGGITRDRAPQVWQAGADVVAVTADLYPEDATPASIRQRAGEWTRMARQ